MLELEKPSMKYVRSFRALMDEFAEHGETIWDGYSFRPQESERDFVERQLRAESEPEQGMVADSIYWAIQESEVVGQISLRHTLNDFLKNYGGHIGFRVRPSYRRQGIATEMLRQILATPKALEIGRLLLTCTPDNVGSNKAILANGGVLEQTIFVEHIEEDQNHYWIEL